MMEEDPTLKMESNIETKQQVLYGMGDMQLDVAVSKLNAKFQVDVLLEDAKVAYRETIKKKVKVSDWMFYFIPTIHIPAPPVL